MYFALLLCLFSARKQRRRSVCLRCPIGVELNGFFRYCIFLQALHKLLPKIPAFRFAVFIGRSVQAVGKGRRNDRIRQLPDLSLRILAGTVAIYHDFYMLAGLLQDVLLNVQNQLFALAREQFDLSFRRFIGSKKAVALVAAASLYAITSPVARTDRKDISIGRYAIFLVLNIVIANAPRAAISTAEKYLML